MLVRFFKIIYLLNGAENKYLAPVDKQNFWPFCIELPLSIFFYCVICMCVLCFIAAFM